MAKAGRHGELNWHKGQQRWYKKIKDQESGKYVFHYFGPKGKGPNDRACKKIADAEWEEYKEVAASDRKAQQFKDMLELVKMGAKPVGDLGDTPFAQELIKQYSIKGMLTAPDKNGDVYINAYVVDPDARDPENDEHWQGDEEEEATKWVPDPLKARLALIERDKNLRNDLLNRVSKQKPKPSKRSKTITQHVDAWLEAEKLRTFAIDVSAR